MKNQFIMISAVFAISLKGNKAASSHIYIYMELRSWDKAFYSIEVDCTLGVM